MTLLLASVRSTDEAEAALVLGADIVDLTDARGALGALNVDTVRAAVQAVKGRRVTSASAGDLPMEPETLAAAVNAMAATRVQYVKVGLFPDPRRGACVARLGARTRDTRLIGVLFADVEPDIGALPALLARLPAAGFAGAILDTRYKDPGRLLDRMDIPALAAFGDACRANGLMTGLAGSLAAPDIPRLLPLAPDVLAFRRALRLRGERAAPLDAAAFRLVRDLIPPAPTEGTGEGGAVAPA
jgi:(5-formylfuran-3-yl)methyl phosphate synthase